MRGSVMNSVGKMQFICLIGGRVCNPRQQHVVNIFRRYSKHATAAGYKPAPPIRQTKYNLGAKCSSLIARSVFLLND